MKPFGVSSRAKPLGTRPKRTISYQRETWIVTNGIRAYTQPKVWPTRMLGPKKRGDYDGHQSLSEIHRSRS